MAWEQLSINKPHLVYIILGGFTSLFMLCSLFVKEKLYIGEATVATICGVIFGPHAANLINPLTWGNTDQITLEFSRIVLVVQCFAVGVELPKAYMERHWKSVVFLLVPVMTFGWLVTSLFIWWMIEPLSWLESLAVAACVTATDPVLASSVVGKGKFAKRVPKHLRDVLSAESGCNDGMAFPFIYLSLYLIHYNLGAKEVVFHWTCFTILYECIFGAFYGVMIGYIGRHAIRLAERKGVIDRESFLVFYFVLALFCAGSGSMLGMDDLLIGFAAGVGFSNDGWFTEKTEESHVSNVIDLLINLAYFVYFGTIIPWDQYNAPEHGLTPWRLVVIAIFVIFFRRIPAMLALKPLIPDVKTWREALFAGHFGPIGVGAIFAAILARAELETDSTEPLARLPAPGSKDYNLIYLVWPVVTFLVISSILVHGSSIAVFTLGKRINTLTITLSYTQDNEKGTAWMNRLPRITSQSKSMSRTSSTSLDDNEKLDIPPGQLPPIGIPKLQLRRQKEDEYEKNGSRSSSLRPTRRRKRKTWDDENRPGGPISASAIAPARRSEPVLAQQESGSDTLFEKSEEPSPQGGPDRLVTGSPTSSPERDMVEATHEHEAKEEERKRGRSGGRSSDRDVEVEAFEEGDDMIIEDEEGNVLDTVDTGGRSPEQKAQVIDDIKTRLSKDKSGQFAKHKHEPHKQDEGVEWEKGAEEMVEHPQRGFRRKLDQWKGFGKRGDQEHEAESSKRSGPAERKSGPAHAYQFGNTIIVEDEDGEVIKKYTLPGNDRGVDRRKTMGETQVRHGLERMGTWVGLGKRGAPPSSDAPATSEAAAALVEGGDPTRDGEERVAKATKTVDKMRRHDSTGSEDDGLRMTISRTDRYGLTGLQRKANDNEGRPVKLGSGRRMSTKDFIRQMQQLDPKSKIQQVDASDAPEDLKKEVRRAAKAEKEADRTENEGERPRGYRTGTVAGTPGGTSHPGSRRPEPESRPGEAKDYFSRPRADRTTTTETLETVMSEDEVEEPPVHDVRGTLVRHGKGQTAADLRRRRLASIRPDDVEEGDEDRAGEEMGETAAEKRRRLAALGMGGDREEDSSDSDEDERPRRQGGQAVQEPGHEDERLPHTKQPQVQAQAQAARLRVQWGGESGRERAREREQHPPTQAEGGSGSGNAGGAVGKRVKGIFGRK